MNLKHLKDSELLSQMKSLVQSERLLLTKVLHHLREVERRRLFSDLGYQSLFEYAVKELKYSEGQAGRRIQAMRLLKELPEIEDKIASGALSLSNISQAQSYFRSAQKKSASHQVSINPSSDQSRKDEPRPNDQAENLFDYNRNNQGTRANTDVNNQSTKVSASINKTNTQGSDKNNKHLSGLSNEPFNKSEKLRLLATLENKSSREGQKLILSMQPEDVPAKERERVLPDDRTEIKFVITVELKTKLNELRALLGTKGATMSFSELISYMADLSIQETKIKKFGKKRVLGTNGPNTNDTKKMINALSSKSELITKEAHKYVYKDLRKGVHKDLHKDGRISLTSKKTNEDVNNQNALETAKSNKGFDGTIEVASEGTHNLAPAPKSLCAKNRRNISKNPRYISQSLRFEVWMRDGGQCTKCGSRKHLNFDHIQPVAFGGESTLDNLRLLCFHCNQRQAQKVFGATKAILSGDINQICKTIRCEVD